MDMLGEVIKLRHASQQLFHQMVRYRDKDTNLVYTNSCATNLRTGHTAEFPFSNKFVRNHWPALERAQLVRRVKRGCFMINPDAVIPLTAYGAAREMWDKLSILGQRTEETAAPTPVRE